MKINVTFDNSEMLRRLPKGYKRLAYASVNAINKTLKRIQKKERERVDAEFTLRRRDFMLREAAKIKPFASVKQARAYGEVAVGEKKRLLLSTFEKGGVRRPVTPGATYVAMPVIGGPARPMFSSKVPPELYMSRLKFARTKTGKRRVGVTRTGTYLVPEVGIFQRVGQEESRMVYFFMRSGARIAARLHFLRTARKITDRWFREEFQREVVKAITRAR